MFNFCLSYWNLTTCLWIRLCGKHIHLILHVFSGMHIRTYLLETFSDFYDWRGNERLAEERACLGGGEWGGGDISARASRTCWQWINISRVCHSFLPFVYTAKFNESRSHKDAEMMLLWNSQHWFRVSLKAVYFLWTWFYFAKEKLCIFCITCIYW